ncbi:beta-ketoacyl synthase N-terminal-like domain-containing protein [Bacillus stercoris]|nr:beta-ketoacyl synthase N-terminal-like domain-containing protein [Bacillus stercoris]
MRSDYVRAKGIIDGPDLFDASFFGYSPGQAEAMDPQIRLLHEYVWKTLEDAGCVSAEYEGKSVCLQEQPQIFNGSSISLTH